MHIKKYGGANEFANVDKQTDEEIDAFVRAKSDSAYHPSCTCRMGSSSDSSTVVSPEGKVMGKCFLQSKIELMVLMFFFAD